MLDKYYVDWLRLDNVCEECEKQQIKAGYCSQIADIVLDYEDIPIDGWRGYDYAVIDGKKYRLVLERIDK